MKVELTQEQIEFIDYLCGEVSDDYEAYSAKVQKEREDMADSIRGALLNVDEKEPIDEEELDKMARSQDYWNNKSSNNEINEFTFQDILNAFKAGYRKAKEE